MVNSCNSFTTIVTTPQYCIGAIVLAKSLKIVKTIYKLRIYVTAPSLESQLLVLGTTHDVLDTIEVLPLNIDEFFEGSTPVENFLDSPRRQLYKLNEPFVYLDCDMIVAQNIDSLMNLIDLKDDTTEFECYAVANFRNKKRAFADVSNSNSMGNFNAGLMVCTKPSTFPALYKCCAEILSDPQFNDTEEKLLNDVYKNKWKPIDIEFNLQKRCYNLNPTLWDSKLANAKILHYVGGKPWQTDDYISAHDWEPRVPAKYSALFSIWTKLLLSNVNEFTPETLFSLVTSCTASISPPPPIPIAIATAAAISHEATWAEAFPALNLTSKFATEDEMAEKSRTLAKRHSAIFGEPSKNIYQNESHASRDQHEELKDKTIYGYGEILPVSICNNIFRILHLHNFSPTTCFDIGSGGGRVLFAANMAHKFQSCVGVEIVPGLHHKALENLKLWNDANKLVGTAQEETKFEFLFGDFTKIFQLNEGSVGSRNIPPNSLIICHSTLFDNDLMAALQCLAESDACPIGTYFLFVSNCLRKNSVSRRTGIEEIERGEYGCTWGEATFYLQRKEYI